MTGTLLGITLALALGTIIACVVCDFLAGWKEREFWLDPHYDDDGYQP